MAETPRGKGAVLDAESAEARVLQIVADLAFELGGPRARRAVTPEASLERDIGLGSLERVELLLRLESELGVRLGEELLRLDTPSALARAAYDPARTMDAGAPQIRMAPLAAAREARPEAARTLSEVLWRRA